MVEQSVERRPPVHQDKTRKALVGFYPQRKSALFSPVALQPLIGESTIAANFTVL
jgi:hypothetical protein